MLTFAGNWIGTGTISGAGDAETVCLDPGEYEESGLVNTGVRTVELLMNEYSAGDDAILMYRHGSTEANCLAADWEVYFAPFASDGYVQVRLEAMPDDLGPLEVSSNTRYFQKPSGEVAFLAFDHTWANLHDIGTSDPPPAFDYDEYLNYLEDRGINGFRLFNWEQSRWSVNSNNDNVWFNPGPPFVRSGTSGALDGKNKWDCSQISSSWLDRLEERVIKAGLRGMYVAVMLFDSFSYNWPKGALQEQNPFEGHPYNASNNINGIDADTDDDSSGEEIEQDSITAITNAQKAYVLAVITRLNKYANVIYEICNEINGDAASVGWTNTMIAYIKAQEAGMTYQHPVGFTVGWPSGQNDDVDASSAEWVSHNGVAETPPANNFNKVSLWDSDHLCGTCIYDPWLAFCMGHNVGVMDEYDGNYSVIWGGSSDVRLSATWETMRRNLGYILSYVARMDLIGSSFKSADTGYCIGKTDSFYLAYQPASANFNIDISESSAATEFHVEYFNPNTGGTESGGTVFGNDIVTMTKPTGWSNFVAFLYAD